MTAARIFTAATAVVLAAACSAALPGAFAQPPATQHGAPPTREVCSTTADVKLGPGAGLVGRMYKGEKVKVRRYSKAGRFARIVAPRPKFTTRGWMQVSDLCQKGQPAQFAKTSRYSVKIENSPAGGDPGFLYVGGPANITVKDSQRAGKQLQVCFTPAPLERSSCRTGRTDQTIDTVVWSQAGATEVRVTIDGGPVLVDTVYPYLIH